MEKRFNGRVGALILAALPLLLWCGGCGGGASHPTAAPASAYLAQTRGTGRVTFRIAWPTPSRLIPEASESLQIRVLDGEKVLKTVVVKRGQTEIKIEELPAKKLVNVLRAFPTADATGVAQAEGTVNVEIKPDEDTAVSLSLESTIDKLLFTPEGGATIDESGKVTLGVSPRNAAGDVVLTKPNGFKYVSLTPDIATVDATGIVTGVSSGTAVIEVTETESGKKSTFTVTVGAVGRVVFSDIAGNVTGTDFATEFYSVDAEDYTDSNDVLIPNISYIGYTFFSSGAGATLQSLDRNLRATLPPDLAIGQTRDVTLSTSNPYYVEYEERRQQTGSPQTERVFDSTGGGTVTYVRRDGDRYTLRFNNVRLEASSADGSVATGRFTINGTITFTDVKPNDDNTDPYD